MSDPNFEYVSTKKYTHNAGFSAAFRQWRAHDTHCRFLHGYALAIRVEFGAVSLDHRNWVVDFGGLDDFKDMLKQQFDHKTLVAEDDPQIEWFREGARLGTMQLIELPQLGCEMFARYVYEAADAWLHSHGYADRVQVLSAEVAEHEGNSAIYRPRSVRYMKR